MDLNNHKKRLKALGTKEGATAGAYMSFYTQLAIIGYVGYKILISFWVKP